MQANFKQQVLIMRIAFRFVAILALLVALALPVDILASDTTTYDYDALGRLCQVTKDDGTAIHYVYDAAGNRESRTIGGAGCGGVAPPTNNPPVASNDFISVPGVAMSKVKNLTVNDSDPDGDSLVITSVTQPSNGYVVILSASSVRVTGNSSGNSSFTYTISDGNGGTDTGTVYVTVQGGGPLF